MFGPMQQNICSVIPGPRRCAGTRNPDGLDVRTAAWIPGSREGARPGMTAIKENRP